MIQEVRALRISKRFLIYTIMAKELPYFKFEPSEWDNGIIQMCSRESKGLFIDICAMYWARLGNLPYKLVVQKLCNGNANALHELMQEQVFSIADEQIVIKFLDIQLSEFGHKSDQASKAAKARWSKHNKNKGKNADAMQTHSKRNAIREDKIRLDKIKEKNRVYAIENCSPTDNQKNDFEDFLSYWFEIGINDKKHKFEKQKSFDWIRRWNTWLKNNEKWQKEKSSAKKENNFSISKIEV